MTTKKTVLVTGAGSGIGKELVRLFVKNEHRIVVFSLLQEELDELSKELSDKMQSSDIFLFQADLSLPGAAQKVVDRCANEGLTIDVLINNAGFALWGEHVEQDIKTSHALMQLNITTLVELSHLFGKKMKQRGHGKILNLGSTMGISPVPLSALYAASKSFVNSFSLALHYELKPYGVQVSCMEPFLTQTKFMTTSLEKSVRGEDPDVEFDDMEKKIAHSPIMVAEVAYKGLMDGKAIILPNMKFHLSSWLMRTLPQPWVARFIYKYAKDAI